MDRLGPTRDLESVLESVGRYHMGTSPIHAAAAQIARLLDEAGIDYAVAGALCLGAHGVVRATEDVDIGGADIRRGDLVIVSLTAANRDPATFVDPDRFDVTRENARQHLAFAQGPHACVGLHLARLETQLAFEAALARWPRLRVDDAATPPSGLVFRKPRSLPVAWDA